MSQDTPGSGGEKPPRIRNKEAEKLARAKRDSLRLADPPKPKFTVKCCGRCGITQAIDQFGKQYRNPDGLNYVCKSCIRVQTAARKSSMDAYSKKWYAENREHRLAIGKEWIKNHSEQYKATTKRYREENADSIRAGIKASIAKNPEKYKARIARWAQQNRDRRSKSVAEYRDRNRNTAAYKQRIAASNKRHRAAHPELVRESERNKRARRRGAEGSHTAKEIKALLALQRFRCANCKVSIKSVWHADHITPLAKGGSNWIRNIQLLCPLCNLRKHAKDPIDWAHENGRLL